MDTTVEPRLLSVYVNDHVTGATAGLGRVQRMASAYEDSSFLGPPLARFVGEFTEERQWLIRTGVSLGVTRNRPKALVAAVAEKVGQLKLNGRAVEQSPLSPLLELEILRGAVFGKLSGWETLEAHADELRLSAEQVAHLAHLQRQAVAQTKTITGLLESLRPQAFSGSAPGDR